MVDLSDTPKGMISRLDDAIRRRGQTIFLARGAGSQHQMRAHVAEYKPAEFVGLIGQADRRVILSPTSLGVYGVPKKKDRFASTDEAGSVEDVKRIRVNDVLVRIELRVRVGG